MSYQYFTVKQEEEIAWVHINRADKRNALCRQLLEEAIDLFQKLDVSKEVKVVILTGNGKTFVAGADIQEMSAMKPLDYMDYGKLYTRFNAAVRENSKPVIGAINGVALGGGNILALSCDIIVAAETAKFALPEIHLGIFGGGALLPRLVGRYRAAELILLGEAYSAQDALYMGLVNKVVPLDDLYRTVTDMANKIKAKSPAAVKLAKQAILAGFYYDFHSATEYQLALMSVLYSSHDQKEGMDAFLHKRQPVFTGQ